MLEAVLRPRGAVWGPLWASAGPLGGFLGGSRGFSEASWGLLGFCKGFAGFCKGIAGSLQGLCQVFAGYCRVFAGGALQGLCRVFAGGGAGRTLLQGGRGGPLRRLQKPCQTALGSLPHLNVVPRHGGDFSLGDPPGPPRAREVEIGGWGVGTEVTPTRKSVSVRVVRAGEAKLRESILSRGHV